MLIPIARCIAPLSHASSAASIGRASDGRTIKPVRVVLLILRPRSRAACGSLGLLGLRQLDPHRSMIARLFTPSFGAIHAGADQTFSYLRTQQQMIDAQPGIAGKGVAEIIPERVDALAGCSVRSASVQPCATSWRYASRVSGRNNASLTQRSGL